MSAHAADLGLSPLTDVSQTRACPVDDFGRSGPVSAMPVNSPAKASVVCPVGRHGNASTPCLDRRAGLLPVAPPSLSDVSGIGRLITAWNCDISIKSSDYHLCSPKAPDGACRAHVAPSRSKVRSCRCQSPSPCPELPQVANQLSRVLCSIEARRRSSVLSAMPSEHHCGAVARKVPRRFVTCAACCFGSGATERLTRLDKTARRLWWDSNEWVKA